MSSLVTVDSAKVGPLSVTHQGQFPSVTLSFNLRPGVALGQAVDAIGKAAFDMRMPGTVTGAFQGNAQAFQSSLSSTPALIVAALLVVYVILGVLYESFIHPLTILSTLPSAGIGAVLALYLGGMDLSVIGIIGLILLIGIVKKNGIMLVDFAITAEPRFGPCCRDPEGVPVAVSADLDDHRRGPPRRGSACTRHRNRFGTAPAPWLCNGGRARAQSIAHTLYDTCRLSLSGSPASLVSARQTRGSSRRRNIGGCCRIGVPAAGFPRPADFTAPR
jgi:hypothetical protein